MKLKGRLDFGGDPVYNAEFLQLQFVWLGG